MSNVRTLRPTKIRNKETGEVVFFEYYRETCPICNSVGGCMVHKDGDLVVCIRKESDRPFAKNSAVPGYMHFLKGEKIRKIDTSKIPVHIGEKKLQNSNLDKIFRSMINFLSLSDSHEKHLLDPKRGLSKGQIDLRRYKSFPEKPWTITKFISNDLGIDDFAGVPGFFKMNGKYGEFWSIKGQEGILIPFRNENNQIVGFQYRIDNPPNVAIVKRRKDGLQARIIKQPNLVQVSFEGEIIIEKEFPMGDFQTIYHNNDLLGWVKVKKGNRYYWLSSANDQNGTSAGDEENPLPVHVAVPSRMLKDWKVGQTLKSRTVWLGEGPLKCDIATDLIERLYDPLEILDIGEVFLALPGVGSWRLAIPILKRMGVQHVNLCFDADVASNPIVLAHLKECALELKKMGLTGSYVGWDEKYKGIDDLMISGRIPEFKRLF